MTDPVVQISDGKLKGTIRKNFKDEDIFAFLGIQYGKPPVGDLRFKAPLPAEPWTGVRDATQDGSRCFQEKSFILPMGGSEDCLFLNVFTHSISETTAPKPVLVFIHGGAFRNGSNSSMMYSPGFLLMEDIVLVTINYRVGILGFMKLNDPSLGVPGNAGLKDQVLALKWVKNNIRKFGGDPENVTIFGESAGSASVNFHVISPMSKGLFHKAIMHSGTVLNPWTFIVPDYLDIVKLIKTDCENEEQILDALTEIPVEKLIEAQTKFDQSHENRIQSFAPCIEVPNETAFLTKHPIDIITSGDYNKVPMIVAFNSNEGLIICMDEMNPAIPKPTTISYDFCVPREMALSPDSDLHKEIVKKLKTIYSNERPQDRYLIAGDYIFVAGIIGFVENAVRTSSEPVYLQRIAIDTPRNIFKKLVRTQEPGTAHGDDLGYLFDFNPARFFGNFTAPLQLEAPEEMAVKRFVRLFGNFLKTGNPTPDPNEFGLMWTPVTTDSLNYLNFDDELNMETDPEEDRIRIWREIYKLHDSTKKFMA